LNQAGEGNLAGLIAIALAVRISRPIQARRSKIL
jgi:hypothetical protein